MKDLCGGLFVWYSVAMSKELFDIVDREDNVIGTTDKKTAHELGQLHRVAAVYVFNKKGELYVQKHRSDGRFDHSVGGHVSRGETYAIGAAREAEEELGITQPLTEIAASVYADEWPHMQHMFGIYECIADDEWEFTPNEEVNIIFPMSVIAIREAMRSEPDQYTNGFKITMAEYARIKSLPDLQ